MTRNIEKKDVMNAEKKHGMKKKQRIMGNTIRYSD